MDFKAKWHGVPMWSWYGGIGVLAGVTYYVYKRRQQLGAASQPLNVDTATDDSGSYGQELGNSDWLKNLGNYLPPVPGTGTVTPVEVPDVPAALNPGSLLETVQNTLNSAGATPNVPAPVPSSISAAPAPTATVSSQTDTIYEPWQKNLGLAVAKPWEVAEPVVVQDQIVGERFLPNPLVSPEPPPPQLYGTPTQPTRIKTVVNGFEVDVTPEQYDFYKKAGFIS